MNIIIYYLNILYIFSKTFLAWLSNADFTLASKFQIKKITVNGIFNRIKNTTNNTDVFRYKYIFLHVIFTITKHYLLI